MTEIFAVKGIRVLGTPDRCGDQVGVVQTGKGPVAPIRLGRQVDVMDSALVIYAYQSWQGRTRAIPSSAQPSDQSKILRTRFSYFSVHQMHASEKCFRFYSWQQISATSGSEWFNLYMQSDFNGFVLRLWRGESRQFYSAFYARKVINPEYNAAEVQTNGTDKIIEKPGIMNKRLRSDVIFFAIINPTR